MNKNNLFLKLKDLIGNRIIELGSGWFLINPNIFNKRLQKIEKKPTGTYTIISNKYYVNYAGSRCFEVVKACLSLIR